MFGRGKHWQIWQINGGSPNFAIQISTMSRNINKESKQAGIRKSFTHQKFLMSNSPKFSSAKHLHYMVIAISSSAINPELHSYNTL